MLDGSAVAMEAIYLGKGGRPRCRRHDKVVHETEADAECVLIAQIQGGRADPGLEVYPCDDTGMWHIGHHGRWRSLGRLQQGWGKL